VEPDNFRFGGGAADTVFSPVIAFALVLAILIAFVLPRKYAVVPLLLIVFLAPYAQVVVIGGVHFLLYRLVILSGFLIVLAKRASVATVLPGRFNAIDKALISYAFFSALVFVLQWMETQALVNQLGSLTDCIGGYLLLRFLIRSEDDVYRVIKVFAVLAVVMAAVMLAEQTTHKNLFEFVGGRPLEVRDGQVRSHAVFQHSILAGAFGATLVPLFAGLWVSKGAKTYAIAGFIGASIMVATSASSTPLVAYAGGIVALCFWPIRRYMRTVQLGLVTLLVALHLAMKAPVWALIARIDLTGSSSGYHRFMLVDNFIQHFSSWWLLGTRDYNTWGWDMFDIGNQYVAAGETGGLITLVCFIALICACFKKLKLARGRATTSRESEWLLWALSSALFAHLLGYLGITYFDQTQVSWYALLAMISAATAIAAFQDRLPALAYQFERKGVKIEKAHVPAVDHVRPIANPGGKSWSADVISGQ
jgi:hypothetical protein